MDWDNAKTELSKKLSPRFVKAPPAGKFGEYIEGVHAIEEANRIFGFDGWSYDVVEIRLTNATMDGDKHRVGYMAVVRATVDNVQRADVGHGQGFGRSEGDAHDSAVKEAVTDGLKRSLRTFGWPLGLALYDKTKKHVGEEEEARDPRKIADALIARIQTSQTEAELNAKIGHERFDKAWSWLHEIKPPMALEVQKAVTDRRVDFEEQGV